MKFSELLRQIIAFFALVRVQNILVLSLAFVLTAKYIFAPEASFLQLLTNPNFIFLLLASMISISSGYIINSFYDRKKDMINRPGKTLIEQQLDLNKRLYLYFFFNFTAVFLAWFISYRATIFFSVYIFLIWFYSHKVHNKTFIGNLFFAGLSIFPFFAIFLYFKRIDWFIFWHAIFLFLVLLLKDFVKSFVNLKGDVVTGNQTIPVKYGEQKAKYLIIFTSILLIAPMYILTQHQRIGNMKYYFAGFALLYFLGLFVFVKSHRAKTYAYFYTLIKVLLVAGVFSIALVNN